MAASFYVAVGAAAAAQEPATRPIADAAAAVGTAALLPVQPSSDRDLQAPRGQPLFPVEPVGEPRRPGALLPLYGSLIALQGLDVHSTLRALDAGGAVEGNPALTQVVRHGAAFVAVKAGATAGVIWASEKMWKKNRKAAVVFAAVVNGAMAAIVAHNYRFSR